VRIHRNALVNISHLESVERNDEGQYVVRVRGCTETLQVSRRMAGELRAKLRL
jgi:DNA-binding LytR/AlgR family response regulator